MLQYCPRNKVDILIKIWTTMHMTGMLFLSCYLFFVITAQAFLPLLAFVLFLSISGLVLSTYQWYRFNFTYENARNKADFNRLLSLLVCDFVTFSLLKWQNTRLKTNTIKSNYEKIHALNIVALICAVVIVLTYLEKFLPKNVNGGRFSLKFLPLLIAAFIFGFKISFQSGMVSFILNLLLFPPHFVHPLVILFDYFFPLLIPSFFSFCHFNYERLNKPEKIIYYFFHVFLPCLFIFFSYTIAGYYFWSSLIVITDPVAAWSYALSYNIVTMLFLTYPCYQLFLPLIYQNLLIYRKKYF